MIDLAQAFRGREILITGVTGFLGKVALTMLLHRYPEVARVYVLVRPRAGGSAEDRFFGKVVATPPFRPLQERHGEGLDAFLREKCVPLAGDVTDPLLGLGEAQVKSLTGRLACVINSAGLVTFNPALELAVSVNTEGARNAAELCRKTGATLVHISTCFVAGARRGPVFEDEPLIGSYPKAHDQREAARAPFSVDAELKDVEALVARLRAQADDHALLAEFRAAAVKRLEEEGRDPADEKALRLASGRERKLWLAGQLVEAGMDRARAWGWPNTYTYTKAMGEQAIAASGCKYALVRPAIVESALRFPFPGWNEGFTTSAPLAFMGLKGQRVFPAGEKLVLDLIPVDLVAAGILGVAGAACADRLEKRVFQLASGDVNPFYVRRAVELVALYKRRYFRERADRGEHSAFKTWLDTWLEPYPASARIYQATSAPLFRAAAKGLRKLIDEKGLKWGAPVGTALLARADQALESVDRQLLQLEATWELFLPFIAGERFIFQCAHTRALWAELGPEDRQKLPWDPERIDWRDYWLEVHMNGLEEWVFPGLEEESRALRREVPAPKDLLQLLAGAVHAFGPRVALRFYAGEDDAPQLARTRDDRVTYHELARFSDRAGHALIAGGVRPGSRVLLMSENRPEWAMAYFGILKAGAAAAPLDHGLSLAEVRNCAAAAKAEVLIASPLVAQRLGPLPGLRTVELPELLRAPGSPLKPLRKSAAPDEVASVLFTSGTAGKPKGVLLTHRNFASLASKLAGLFDLRVGEGVLSVLPLHHTFEFSCGLLTPLLLGAEITYLDELTAERLSEALNSGRVHAMIGVPALWQLLHRRLTQELAAQPRLVRAAVQAAMALHGELRNRTSFNVGKLLFWPLHNRFGGRLRLLVSGGSALPEEVQRAFHELGFDLTEGYGLTEAAPVLAVTVPDNKLRSGTVGPPLPGVEIRIEGPDADGVGEVLARGPNVMSGYLDDPQSTAAALEDGWLHTGDLGRLDRQGRLTLVGRKKDLILDASGKNVYPDELEEIYGATPLLKELSIVGLPDGNGHEKVACLCVPQEPREGETCEQIRDRLQKHFAAVSSELPFWKRIKVLHFWDGELPRTATRKVKRPLVLTELQRLERATAAATKLSAQPAGTDGWLFDLLADLSQKPRGSVTAQTRLAADLGFDSLLVAELTAALQKAGVKAPLESQYAALLTASDLSRALQDPDGEARDGEGSAAIEEPEGEIPVPQPVAAAARAAIGFFQKALYGRVFDLEVKGEAHVPRHAAFLVAANHASHLDVGLVKIALGEEGRKLASLAARDYFFDNPWKRAWFGNFTNLVPIERHGGLKESLQTAVRTLEYGYHLLIFPEGTRSVDGQMQEFKPAIAYLSFAARADILPVYLEGTHEAMPKGAFAPDPRRRRKLAVRIGPALRYEDLKAVTQGLSRSAAHREVTRLVRLAIEALRDGKPPPRPEPGRLLEARR